MPESGFLGVRSATVLAGMASGHRRIRHDSDDTRDFEEVASGQ
jgi:hypothetical protein